MERERRSAARVSTKEAVVISWVDSSGVAQTADVQAVNKSRSGLAFESEHKVPEGTVVYIAPRGSSPERHGVVRHSTENSNGFVVGVELEQTFGAEEHSENYYELLQISPSAHAGTIHRVFRYLAGLYHPDNPETGDPERFLELNRAYHVLSDPQRRAAYDAQLNQQQEGPSPAFSGVDFMDGVEGELNRRLAILAVLYRKCRSNIHDARVRLVDLESEMGFPREYLDFSTWYLRSKKYITKEDNSDFMLTASGVDFIEENYTKIPLLRKMLNAGREPKSGSRPERENSEQASRPRAPLVLPLNNSAEPGEPK